MSKIPDYMRSLSARVWIVISLVVAAIISVTVTRLAEWLIPPGTELNTFLQYVAWMRDTLNSDVTTWLFLLAAGATLPYIWGQVSEWISDWFRRPVYGGATLNAKGVVGAREDTPISLEQLLDCAREEGWI